ncbi:Bifunctional IPC transferase and DIPP synthase [Burkholderiales bacterium]|nr:Bifunctional IPC transferase and DIPP synthase [Burkholderiales bacterium]
MPESSLDHVVVLAAGMGLRLGPAAGGRPKALVEVAGRTLLEHALRFAAALGAREIIVVAGYRGDLVGEHLAALAIPGARLVDNPRYRDGNLYSVEAALARVRGAFLLANCDHVFPDEAARRVTGGFGGDVTAWCEFERPLAPDEMKVVLDASGAIVRIAKTLTDYDGGYIGLTHVPAVALASYRRAVDRARARHGDGAVAEQALQALADNAERVLAASLDGISWSEVDTPADLALANERVRATPLDWPTSPAGRDG